MTKGKSILVSSPRYWSLVNGYELHKRRITYMSLNQDSKCNANCRGCFRYPERKKGLVNLLNMDDYIFLLDEFKKFGGLAIEISGEGEPLLPQTNTLPIIRYATNLGIWTTLITNGLSLTHEIITELKSLRVALVISLHSLKKELYEKDNGFPDSFEIAMKNIGSISDIFQNTSWQENGFEIKRACIHWTLQADNISEIPAIREFCHSKDLHFSIAPLANVGSASSSPEILLTEGFSNLGEINNQGDESIIFYDEPSGKKVCGTCKYGLNIGADGNILLDAHGGYEVKIANIRDISFPKALEYSMIFLKGCFPNLIITVQ